MCDRLCTHSLTLHDFGFDGSSLIDSKLLCRTKDWQVLTGRQVFIASSGSLSDPANAHASAALCLSLPAGSSILLFV